MLCVFPLDPLVLSRNYDAVYIQFETDDRPCLLAEAVAGGTDSDSDGRPGRYRYTIITELKLKLVCNRRAGPSQQTTEDKGKAPFQKSPKLQRQLEFLEVQEEYIKDEQKNLKKEYLHAQEEVKRIQSVPLVIGQFLEAVDQNTGIVGSTTGSNYYVRILSTIDRELLKPSASVALHKHSNALVDVLPPEADSSITMLQADEKPDVSYADIGGMDIQKQEVREGGGAAFDTL
nr:hypothetical protein BaRGS_023982 [Batillaria attramentaria]